MIGGLMEKRVFVQTSGERLYPNMFVLLVAPPGVGKTQAIKVTKAFWKKIPELFVSPDNMTKAALVDVLKRASRKIVKSGTELVEFNSLQIAADELGVFMSAHDLDFLSALNKIFDCPDLYEEERRMFKGETLVIPDPQITMLAGTQPGFMASVFPEEAWGMGFTSRLIMLYSSQKVMVPLFDMKVKEVIKFDALVKGLKARMKLLGEFKWSREAANLIQSWHMIDGKKTEPQHTKLEHYNARRIMHLLKLCMIASISRSTDLRISEEDFRRALAWLIMAEQTMPDVFRNMSQKSDAMTIQELHFHALQIWAKEKKEIHESRLIHFLQTKVPSDRVQKILEIAERAGFLIRSAGSQLYKPALKNNTGLE
jgi:hypothetical protein